MRAGSRLLRINCIARVCRVEVRLLSFLNSIAFLRLRLTVSGRLCPLGNLEPIVTPAPGDPSLFAGSSLSRLDDVPLPLSITVRHRDQPGPTCVVPVRRGCPRSMAVAPASHRGAGTRSNAVFGFTIRNSCTEHRGAEL